MVALRAELQAWPKAELHVHLEGSLSPETVWELARRNQVALPAETLADWRRFYAFRDFSHFIAWAYSLPASPILCASC